MKLIKLLSILVFSFACMPQAYAMEAPAAESEQSAQVQLTDLPPEKLLEIIEHGIDQAQTLKEAWEFIQNLALTNRQFAALTRDTAVVNTLAQKVKDPQQELFDLARTKEKIGDIAALINIAALIKAGADVDKQCEEHLDGSTALMMAAANGHETIVRAFLKSGADVNKKGNWDATALMVASSQGHEAVVRELLQAGAYVNERAVNNLTALIIACVENHEAVVRVLLEKGADVTIRGLELYNGKTALDLAKAPEIKDMLQEAMERQSNNNNNE